MCAKFNPPASPWQYKTLLSFAPLAAWMSVLALTARRQRMKGNLKAEIICIWGDYSFSPVSREQALLYKTAYTHRYLSFLFPLCISTSFTVFFYKQGSSWTYLSTHTLAKLKNQAKSSGCTISVSCICWTTLMLAKSARVSDIKGDKHLPPGIFHAT